jgi:cytochrome c oxidase subunit 3/cytochrome o ubiquinol oxidase subunit 3
MTPSRDRVGMVCLIIAEGAMFTIFVVAYLFYLGKSPAGPTPREVLSVPVVASICLWSSSATIEIAQRLFHRGKRTGFAIAWSVTIALGVIFLAYTGVEWARLIGHHGLTPATNLFGTTYFSLVGLHALHVTVGLILLSTVLLCALAGKVRERHREPIGALSLYWHFVDGVWVVVFSVVYLFGR